MSHTIDDVSNAVNMIETVARMSDMVNEVKPIDAQSTYVLRDVSDALSYADLYAWTKIREYANVNSATSYEDMIALANRRAS